MAEAKTKQYRIEVPYYRQGTLYPPGSVVTIPASEKPARSWVELKETPATKAAAEPPSDPSAPKRASDKAPI